MRPFDPDYGATVQIANSTTASAVANGVLEEGVTSVALYNSSTTAMAYFVCLQAADARLATTADMIVPPGNLIRITVPRGPKRYSVIASAADGNLFIASGQGN